MKKIGIIGGLSAESTNHYIQLINKDVNNKLGGHHAAELIVRYVNFQTYCDLKEKGDWDTQGTMLAGEALTLKQAGADVIILATNTMHKLAPQIIEALGDTPFIHLADATADEAIKRSFKTVGFLGTKYSMELEFYTGRLVDRGLKPMTPETSEERAEISRIIYDELTKGDVRQSSEAYYIQTIEKFKTRGADAVILGCTEIGMLINKNNSPLPVLDTTEIHALCAVDFSLS